MSFYNNLKFSFSPYKNLLQRIVFLKFSVYNFSLYRLFGLMEVDENIQMTFFLNVE